MAVTLSFFGVFFIATQVQAQTCALPPYWGEVGYIFKECNLVEVERYSNLSDMFSPAGANGSFDYCNTLIWREYDTDAGKLYTYEKVRYQHFPNSEVGEYRAPAALYDEMTNTRSCTPSDNIWFDPQGMTLSDDDMSSLAFPSRNMPHDTSSPDYFASFFNRHYEEHAWGKPSLNEKFEQVEARMEEHFANQDSAPTTTPQKDTSWPWIIAALLIIAGFVAIAYRSSKGSIEDEEPVSSQYDQQPPKQDNSAGTVDDQELKALYKRVIKKYHPDFAQNDTDRKFRNDLTAKLNKAYQNKDIDTLRIFDV